MGSRYDYAESAMSAAGVVGAWEIDSKANTASIDLNGSRFFYGDTRYADVHMSFGQAFSVVHEDDFAAVVSSCTTMIARGGPVLFECRVNASGQGLRRIQVRGSFSWNEKGDMMGRGIFLDVTHQVVEEPRPAESPVIPAARMIPPSADPLADAAARSIELRKALGRSGNSALRLAADLLLWEINTALAARHTISHKDVPALKKAR